MEKNLPAMQKSQETWAQSLGQGDPLEKAMETHSSILLCRIPWTEEACGVQSIGSQQLDMSEVTEHAMCPHKCQEILLKHKIDKVATLF